MTQLSVLPSPPGMMPHMLEHLWLQFTKDVDLRLALLARTGVPVNNLKDALSLATAADFVNFAVKYLNANRVTENFPVNHNHGIRLSDNSTMSICPHLDMSGRLQESVSMPVTGIR